MKKILLLGSHGMLGAVFLHLFHDRDYDVVSPSSHSVDITDEESVIATVRDSGADVIINCAAYTAVDKAEDDREQAYAVNAKALFTIGEAAHNEGAYVLHVSTDYVFDGMKHEAYCEEDVCDPCNYYGFTKWQGEQYLLDQCPESCVLRTSWLFGVYGGNFVATILRLLHERDEISIVADQWGRPTSCDDLAVAALKLVEAKASGVYHYANSGGTTWYDFACEIYRKALAHGLVSVGKKIIPIPSEYYPTRARRPRHSTLATTKIAELIGDEYLRPWSDALEHYLIQYKERLS